MFGSVSPQLKQISSALDLMDVLAEQERLERHAACI